MYATGDKDILLVNSKKCAPAGTRHNATITIVNRRRDLSSTAFSRTNEKPAKPIDSVRFGSKADIRRSLGLCPVCPRKRTLQGRPRHVRFVPIADVPNNGTTPAYQS